MNHAVMYCQICDHLYLDAEYDDDLDMCGKCAEVTNG